MSKPKLRCDILHKAADLILEGFAKGTRHKHVIGHHSMCILGALETANTGRKDWHYGRQEAECHPATAPLVELVAELIPDQRWSPATTLASWNNAEERTAQEVADKLREAAAICKVRNQEEPTHVADHQPENR